MKKLLTLFCCLLMTVPIFAQEKELQDLTVTEKIIVSEWLDDITGNHPQAQTMQLTNEDLMSVPNLIMFSEPMEFHKIYKNNIHEVYATNSLENLNNRIISIQSETINIMVENLKILMSDEFKSLSEKEKDIIKKRISLHISIYQRE